MSEQFSVKDLLLNQVVPPQLGEEDATGAPAKKSSLAEAWKASGVNVTELPQNEVPANDSAEAGMQVEEALRRDPFFKLSPESSKLLYDRWKNTDALNRYAGIPWSAFKEMLPHIYGQAGGAVKELALSPFNGDYKKIPATLEEAVRQFAMGTADLGVRAFSSAKDKLLDVADSGGEEGQLERFRKRQNLYQTMRQWSEGALQSHDFNPNLPGRQGMNEADSILPNTAAIGSLFIPVPGGVAAGAVKAGVGAAARGAVRGAVRAGVMSAETAAKAAQAAEMASRAAGAVSTKLGQVKQGIAGLPARAAESLVEKVGLEPKVGAGAVEQAAYVARKPFVAAREYLGTVPPEFRGLASVGNIGSSAIESSLSLTEKGLEAIRRLKALPPSQSSRLRQLALQSDTPLWLKKVAKFAEDTKMGAAAELTSDLTKGAAKSAAHGYVTGLLISDDPSTAGQFAALNVGQSTLANGVKKVVGVAAAQRRAAGIRGDLAGLYLHLEQSGMDPETIKHLKDNEAEILAAFDNPNEVVGPDGVRRSDTIYGSAALAATYLANLNPRIRIRYLTGKQFAEAHPDAPNNVGSHKDNEVHINLESVKQGTSLAGGTLMHELAHNLAKVAGKDGSARVFIDNLLGPEKVAEARAAYAEKTLQGQGIQNPTPEQIAKVAASLDTKHGGDSWVYSEIYAEAAKKAFSTDLMRDVLGRNRSIWRRVRNAVADHFSSTTKDSQLPADALFAISEVYSPEMRRRLTQDLREMYQDAGRAATGRENDVIGVNIDQVKKGTPAVAKDADGLRVDANNQLIYDEKAARRMQTQRAAAVRKAVTQMPPAPASDTAPDVKPRPGLDGRTEVAQGTRVSPLMESTGLFSKTAIDLVKGIEQMLANGSGTVFRLWYNPIGTSAEGRTWNKDVAFRRGNIPATQVDMAFYDFHVSKQGHVLARGMSLTAAERRLAEWSANPESPLNKLWQGDTDTFRQDLDTYLANHAKGLPGETNIGVQRKNALNFFILGRLARLEDLNPLRVQSAKSLIRSLRVDRMASMSAVQDKSMPLNYQKLAENFSPGLRLEQEARAGGTTPEAERWSESQGNRSDALLQDRPLPPPEGVQAPTSYSPPTTIRRDGLPHPVDDPANTPFPRAPQALREATTKTRTVDPVTGVPTWFIGQKDPNNLQSVIDVVPKSTFYRDLVTDLLFEKRRKSGETISPSEIRETWITMAREDTPSDRVINDATLANANAGRLLTFSDAEVNQWVKDNNPSPQLRNSLAQVRDLIPVIDDNSPIGLKIKNRVHPDVVRQAGGSEGEVFWFRQEPDYVYKVVRANVAMKGMERMPNGERILTAEMGSRFHGDFTKADRQSRLPGGLPADILGVTERGDVILKMPRMERHATPAEVARWKASLKSEDWLGTSKAPASYELATPVLKDQSAFPDKNGNYYMSADIRFQPAWGGGMESPNVMVDRMGRVFATDIALLPLDDKVLSKNQDVQVFLAPKNPDKMLYSPESGKEFDKFDPKNYPPQPPAPAEGVSNDIYGAAWRNWDVSKMREVAKDSPFGFTINKQAKVRGEGFAVAPWKKTEFYIPEDQFKDEVFKDYIQEHMDEFRTHGAHLGGWQNNDAPGKPFILDIVFPVEKIEDAVKLAIWGNQDAIFDLKTLTQINTKRKVKVTKNGIEVEENQQFIPDGVNLTLEDVWKERGTISDLRAFASRAVRDTGGVREPGLGPNQEKPLDAAPPAGPGVGESGKPPGESAGEFSPPTRKAAPEELVKEGELKHAPAADVEGHLIMSSMVPEENSKGLRPERDQLMFLDWDTLKLLTTSQYTKLLKKLKRTSGLFTKEEMRLQNPEKLTAIFIDRAKQNLRWLWDKAEPWRDRAKLWYDGANTMANEWSKNYKISVNQVAGVLAACSPKTDWFRNIEIAKRIIEGFLLHEANEKDPNTRTVFTEKLFGVYEQFTYAAFDTSWKEIRRRKYKGASKKPEVQKAWEDDKAAAKAILDAELAAERRYIGQTWGQLASEKYGQATLLRAYDVANNKQFYYVYSPEGKPLYVKMNKGKKRNPVTRKMEYTEAAQGWTTYDVIRDSINMLRDGSPENISNILGRAHKVRNFYNNILVPTSNYPFVTIDTWAVNASYILPGAAESKMVTGGVSEGGAPLQGIKGGYILHALAAIELAKELSAELGYKVHPREVQSVTWEAIRALFSEDKKGGELDKQTHALKREWQRGKITLDEYYKRVEELWGGFDTPEWAMGEAVRVAIEQGILPDLPQQPEPGRVSAPLGGPGSDSSGNPGASPKEPPGAAQAGADGRGSASDGRTASQAGGVTQFSPRSVLPPLKLGRNRDFAKPPTREEALAALAKSSEAKLSKYGRPSQEFPVGEQVGLRIDIPSFTRGGQYVVTVHDRRGKDPMTMTPGTVFGYEDLGRVKNPVFVTNEKEAAKIRDGKDKTPIAVVNGKWNPSKEIPADIDKWTPVGFDPKKHSYFYDKRDHNNKMLIGGDEAISVGNTVFVKNPIYGDVDTALYSPASRPSNKQWVSDFEKKAQNIASLPADVLMREAGQPRDTSFHVNTLVGRMLNTLNPGDLMDRRIQNARDRGAEDRAVELEKRRDALDGALGYVRPLLADLVASLPAKRAKDLRTGALVDPYMPMRESFPGGTKRDVTEVLAELGNVVRSSIPDPVNQRGAIEHILNLARVAREQGAKVNEKFLDHLFVDVHGKTESELYNHNAGLLSQMFNPEFYNQKKMGKNLSRYSPIDPNNPND